MLNVNEIEKKAQEIKELQSLVDEAQAEIDSLKDAIKAAMGDAESVQAGAFKISWKAITNTRLDTAALKKALPEVAERFTKTSSTRRFTIA